MSNYFDFLEADSRDRQLQIGKKMGVVPEGCLLNGSLVMGLHYTAPVDAPDNYVCGLCKDGPRARCGGAPYREREEAAPELEARDRHKLSPDDASFRGLERQRVAGVLDKLVGSKS